MANLTVTGTTEVTTLTENAATINRSRVVAGVTAGVSVVANPASVPIYRATISSVFTGISMAVTGLTDLNTLHETAVASSTFFGVFDWEITDIIIAGDSTFVVWNEALTDVVNVSDSQTHDWIATLDDNVVQVTSEPGPVIWDANISPSSFEAREYTEVFLSEFLTDVVNVSETFTLISREVSYDNTFTATEELVASNEHTESLTSVVEVSNTLVHGISEELVTGNVVLATATFTDTVLPNETFVDTFFATSTPTDTVSAWDALLSIVDVSDQQIIAGAIANTSLHETFTASEVLWANDFGALAWVLNTETAGLSTYDNFGFNSVAAQDGVLYATSPEGVFVLNADKDQARNVDALVQTGMLDFNIEVKKRISDVYVGYTGGQLQYSIETVASDEVYTYEMPEREANAPRNNRVKPGKGLSSRYWRFTVENIDGADFQLHDQVAEIGASTRRL